MDFVAFIIIPLVLAPLLGATFLLFVIGFVDKERCGKQLYSFYFSCFPLSLLAMYPILLFSKLPVIGKNITVPAFAGSALLFTVAVYYSIPSYEGAGMHAARIPFYIGLTAGMMAIVMAIIVLKMIAYSYMRVFQYAVIILCGSVATGYGVYYLKGVAHYYGYSDITISHIMIMYIFCMYPFMLVNLQGGLFTIIHHAQNNAQQAFMGPMIMGAFPVLFFGYYYVGDILYVDSADLIKGLCGAIVSLVLYVCFILRHIQVHRIVSEVKQIIIYASISWGFCLILILAKNISYLFMLERAMIVIASIFVTYAAAYWLERIARLKSEIST